MGSDPNTSDVLTYAITAPSVLPAGASLTQNIFTWTPNFNQGGVNPYDFTFAVTDQSGLSASQSIMILVNNTNRAPVFTTELPAGVVVPVNVPDPIAYTFKYAATDPDNDNIFFSLISGPFGSSITSDGEFSWAPTQDQLGKSYTVAVQVSDGKLSTMSYQIITAADKTTDVKVTAGIPNQYQLFQNYPNPFNPSTTITFDIPESGFVALTLYNMLGEKVDVLVNRVMNAGSYKVNYNATKLNSGIYFYRIQTNNFAQVKKMILLK